MRTAYDRIMRRASGQYRFRCQFTLTSSNSTIEATGTKAIIISTGKLTICVTLQLAVLEYSTKFPVYGILNSRIKPKKQLFRNTGIILRCHMSANLMKDWLSISWSRTRCMLFIEHVLLLEPF